MQIYSEERPPVPRIEEQLNRKGLRAAVIGDWTAFAAFFWELRDRNRDAAESLNFDAAVYCEEHHGKVFNNGN